MKDFEPGWCVQLPNQDYVDISRFIYITNHEWAAERVRTRTQTLLWPYNSPLQRERKNRMPKEVQADRPSK